MKTSTMYWIEAFKPYAAGHPSLPTTMQWSRIMGHDSFPKAVALLEGARRGKPKQKFRLVKVSETIFDI